MGHRIVAVLAACVCAAAVAVVAGGWTSSTAGLGTAVHATPVHATPPYIVDDPPVAVADDVLVYAAALRQWQPTGTIQVHDKFCFRGEACVSRPIPLRVRYELPGLLHGRVRFVSAEAGSITLDRAMIVGERATLRLQHNCGDWCVSGEQVDLVREAGRWRVLEGGERWIS